MVTGYAAGVTLQIYRAGTDPAWVHANDLMTGAAVTDPTDLGGVHGRRAFAVTLGPWASGEPLAPAWGSAGSRKVLTASARNAYGAMIHS